MVKVAAADGLTPVFVHLTFLNTTVMFILKIKDFSCVQMDLKLPMFFVNVFWALGHVVFMNFFIESYWGRILVLLEINNNYPEELLIILIFKCVHNYYIMGFILKVWFKKSKCENHINLGPKKRNDERILNMASKFKSNNI